MSDAPTYLHHQLIAILWNGMVSKRDAVTNKQITQYKMANTADYSQLKSNNNKLVYKWNGCFEKLVWWSSYIYDTEVCTCLTRVNKEMKQRDA